ncbi:hypothetical protein [Dysgonomonas sp. Marseille-P4361]|uniref:hypothetical protein n=1 Tax=Dysgonomonas sp. Marseille-P4361 TaxID=2161820 RepID=UPI000D55959B|nr:hypothetical protein [Dysgonomonas sp. Marseille-P4361]
MKSIFTYLLLLMFFTSCGSTYFLSTLDSKNTDVEKQDNGDFLIETDSLWIAYCFNGQDAPVWITVYNKLDKPLYVDWKKSALVINDEAFSYAGGKLDISGSGDFYQYDTGYGTSSFGGTMEKREDITFVPPKSKVSFSSLSLNFNFNNLDKELYEKGYMLDKEKGAFKVNRISFNEETSPILIQSFLTVYEKPEKPMLFKQDFFMTEVVKTKSVSPQKLSTEQMNRGDFFYSIKPSNNDVTMTIIGVAVVGVAAVGLIVGGGSDVHLAE